MKVLLAFLALCCMAVIAQHPRHCGKPRFGRVAKMVAHCSVLVSCAESPLEFEANGFQVDAKL